MSNKERRRNILTLVTIAIIIIFGSGIYLYYYFFRQVNAKLIETIPTDAAFMFQINDNDTFLKTVKHIHNYISPLFGLDAYPGCQFFLDQLPGKYNQVVFTGHDNGKIFSILFACKINERAFKQLLSKIQIDEKNYTQFEQCKIYTHGTHLKRFVFTYHKGIFLASENITLLKKAITQLKNTKNLTNLKSFETLFDILEKNKKQNWLILNHDRYFSHFESFFTNETHIKLTRFATNVSWAAYQVRFSKLEMSLSGYLSLSDSFQNYFNNLENKYFYHSSLCKNDESIDYEKDIQLQYAKTVLPSTNDYEFVIHAANSEYWSRYLFESGLKKFPAAQIKLFAFTFSLDSLPATFPQIQPANGLIKF
jgi:hypothetical protein